MILHAEGVTTWLLISSCSKDKGHRRICLSKLVLIETISTVKSRLGMPSENYKIRRSYKTRIYSLSCGSIFKPLSLLGLRKNLERAGLLQVTSVVVCYGSSLGWGAHLELKPSCWQTETDCKPVLEN